MSVQVAEYPAEPSAQPVMEQTETCEATQNDEEAYVTEAALTAAGISAEEHNNESTSATTTTAAADNTTEAQPAQAYETALQAAEGQEQQQQQEQHPPLSPDMDAVRAQLAADADANAEQEAAAAADAARVQEELHRPLTPDMDAVHAQLAADAAAEEAEVEAAKAAVEVQAEEEADIDERRQLCSEIVALRKELTIVKEDEANLRAQLVHTAHVIATQDPTLAEQLARLEEQAADSQMAHLWHEQCQQHNPDKADWSTININDMPRRMHAAKEHFAETTAQAAQLYRQLEVQINQHTDYREEVKARMQQAYNEELTNTAPARARLHQVEDEKRFHAKRGTTRKPASATAVVPDEKKTISRQRRIDTAEVRTAAEIDKLNGELSDLMAECKMLKQRLDNSRKMQEERQSELAAALTNVRDNGATVRETKQRLLHERDELQALKADLQAVLHYVRAKQREEDALL